MATRTAPVRSQKALAMQAYEQLAILGGKLTSEDDVVFQGTKLIIPEQMTLEQAARFINQRVADEENTYALTRVFKYRPWDGARATAKAIKDTFGFTMGHTIRTFFGDHPPQLIDIDIDVDQQEQVPWGAMKLPFLDSATLHLGQTRDEELGIVFTIQVECKRKDRFTIEGLFRLIEKTLVEDSIYRGKAITGAQTPGFIDTTHVQFDDVVYTKEVMQQLEANIWSRIRYAEQLQRLGQPVKRTVLLEGPYGSGKSLAAMLTAKVCQQHGWTFLMNRPGQDDWMSTLATGRIYGPCVVFMEDIDTIAGPGAAIDVSKILDQFDGVATKGKHMVCVLTTNHPEQIHKAMLRPGRLDAMIHIGEMDRDGVEKLARRIIGKALADDVDFDVVYEAVHGFMPAYVREAFDRTVGYSVVLHDGELGPIGTDEIVLAAHSLRPQLQMMEGAAEKRPTTGVDGALQYLIDETVSNVVASRLDGAEIYDEDDDYRGKVRTA